MYGISKLYHLRNCSTDIHLLIYGKHHFEIGTVTYISTSRSKNYNTLSQIKEL